MFLTMVIVVLNKLVRYKCYTFTQIFASIIPNRVVNVNKYRIK